MLPLVIPADADAALYRICKFFGQHPKEVLGRSRKACIVEARHVFVYALLQNKRYTQAKIAYFLSRDHATISNSVEAVKHRMIYEKGYKARLNEVMAVVEVAMHEHQRTLFHLESYRGTRHIPVFDMPVGVGHGISEFLLKHAKFSHWVVDGWVLETVPLLNEELPGWLKMIVEKAAKKYPMIWLYDTQRKTEGKRDP